MEKIFDVHAHYDDSAFDNDRDDVLSSLLCTDVAGIVNGATDIKSALFGIELSKKYNGFIQPSAIIPKLPQKPRKALLIKSPN